MTRVLLDAGWWLSGAFFGIGSGFIWGFGRGRKQALTAVETALQHAVDSEDSA